MKLHRISGWNMRGLRALTGVGLPLLLWLLGSPFAQALSLQSAGALDVPKIATIQIESTEVVITVNVPRGVRKVTLESRPRLGAGTWVPRAVQRVDGAGATLTFRLPKSSDLEILRVRGDQQEALPATFYAGSSTFSGQQQTGDTPAAIYSSLDYVGRGLEDANGTGVPPTADGTAQRDVVESDIWVIRNGTLYFFNQYRGLQVIDLTSPAEPVLKGELSIAAAGEQMYLLNDQYAVLLARDGCGWSTSESSQVLVVDVSGPAPQIAARVALGGTISESRLVGEALYVACQTYRKTASQPRPGGVGVIETWEWGTQVTGIDLATPTQPATRETLWFNGYGNIITATDRYLFAVSQDPNNWWQSRVQVVDIRSPDGSLKALSEVKPAGRVADKFKLHLYEHETLGDVLAVISEDTQANSGNRASVLQTFSLRDPTAPVRLGQVAVGHGEGLYATRFDGDRAYIVTFLRIDPLWVVDLKDPANPKVTGELEVPGWSNYIHPLGDRLVTIGIDNSNSWKVAVSLFDVRDPAKPALLSKVPLGEFGSWSEANQDEKAFTVLPDAGLILVPYQSWSTDGYASQVQLIDLGTDHLKARGVINHQLQPRRATVYQDHILSISGRELLVVDATDRDHPVVAGQKELSWSVSRVLVAGDYLIQLNDGSAWYEASAPGLYVVSQNAPTTLLNHVALDRPWAILGATVEAGHLFILQGENQPYPPADQITSDFVPKGNLALSVYALNALPSLPKAGEVVSEVAQLGYAANLKALRPKPGVIVWGNSGNTGYSWWRWPWIDATFVGAADVAGGALWYPWWSGGSGRLFAYSVENPAAPKLAADVTLPAVKDSWGFSEAHSAGGLVFLSHQHAELLGTTESTPGTTDGSKTILPPSPRWETKYYLDVVDFADPVNPTVRAPIDLPGRLLGVAVDGALLYTTGWRYNNDGASDGTEYIDGSAYDGVEVALAASMKMPSEWPRALLVQNDALWIARPESGKTTGWLEAWRVEPDAAQKPQFTRISQTSLATPASTLAAFGNLLAAQASPRIDLFDLADPAKVKPLGSATQPGCVWTDLQGSDGSIDKGLWVPLQDYGLFAVPIQQ